MNKFFWTKYNFVGCQIKIHWLIIKTTKNENITKDNLTQIETENCLQVFLYAVFLQYSLLFIKGSYSLFL